MTENERIILIEAEQRSKSNSHRLDNIELGIKEIQEENKAIYKIATSVEVMAEKLGNIEDKVDQTNRKVEQTIQDQRASEERFLQKVTEIENYPAKQAAKNINEIKVKVLTAAVSFVVTGILAAIIHFNL